nr:hypothetical protein [Tanacetum cinerariifolium]
MDVLNDKESIPNYSLDDMKLQDKEEKLISTPAPINHQQVDELIDVHEDKTTVLQENVKDQSNKSQYVNVVTDDYKPCLASVFANVKAKSKKCGIERNYVLRVKERKKRLAIELDSLFGQQATTTPALPKLISTSVNGDFIAPPKFLEKSQMELYMMNRQHGRMIFESVENGPLIWPSIEENGVTRPKKYSELSATKAIQADCDKGDDPIDAINHMMSFMTAVVTSQYLPTNKMLRNSSNPRQQATINNGRVTVQIIHGRHTSLAAGTSRTYTSRASGNKFSDSNIIPYSQCVSESQHEAVQNLNFPTQQDALILSVIKQLKTQVVNCTKINLDNKSVNETLTAELERYKDQVRILKEGHNVDLKGNDIVSDSYAQSVEIDNLEQTLSEH